MKKSNLILGIIIGSIFYLLNWIIGWIFNIITPVTWLIALLTTPFKSCGYSCSEMLFLALISSSLILFIFCIFMGIILVNNFSKKRGSRNEI
ncbi:MAG: hypothetical protein QXY45_02840 [Candidatus Aenigmatarchaeota archaeon]